jgi:competence protein ComEA
MTRSRRNEASARLAAALGTGRAGAAWERVQVDGPVGDPVGESLDDDGRDDLAWGESPWGEAWGEEWGEAAPSGSALGESARGETARGETARGDVEGLGDRGRGGRHTRTAARPSWLTTPAGVRGARVAVARPALVAVVVLVVCFAVVFGVRLLQARHLGTPVAASSPGSGEMGGGPAPAGTSGSPTSSPTAAGPVGATPAAMSGAAATGVVVVHVVGQVRHPGVIELPAGSRVVDAVAKAGGATKGADLSAVNLARVLIDGEQLLIPKPGEAVGASAPGAGAGGAASGPAAPAPINLNSADLAALDGLPGVGPVLAGRILAWRAEHGRFSSVDELGEVSGIGEKVLANLRPLVTV